MSEAYGRALEEARKELAAGMPAVMAASAAVAHTIGAAPGKSVFRVPFLDLELQVAYPEGTVGLQGREASIELTIVVLHYLSRSSGPLPLTDPVRYQGLSGAGAFAAAFRSRVEIPLIRRFEADEAAFVKAVRAAGGADQGTFWRLPFLPCLPLGVRLGLAEDGLPGECVLLFPRRAGFVYLVEDLAVAGQLLAGRMLGLAASGGDGTPGLLQGDRKGLLPSLLAWAGDAPPEQE